MKPRVVQGYLGDWKIIYPWGTEYRMASKDTWPLAIKFALDMGRMNHARVKA